jgi:predicted RNase H-like HicB family nuclease
MRSPWGETEDAAIADLKEAVKGYIEAFGDIDSIRKHLHKRG